MACSSSGRMAAGHDGLQLLVSQEVGGEVVPFGVGLFEPGDG